LIGIIVVMSFSLSTAPKFVATSEIFLSTPRFNNVASINTSPYQSDDFTQRRARSYVQLAARVIAKLGIDMQPDALAAATSASVPPDTVLIDISVKSTSAAEAKVLADAMTAELARDIRTLESRSGLGVPVIEPIVTQPAETPKKPSEPDIPTYLLFGASGGFLIGITAASLLARRRVDDTQVEQFTGRPVLGRIMSNSADPKNVAHGEPSTPNRLTRQWDVIQKNVGFELAHSRDRVLAVTTENGSGGSSATAAGLASAFAHAGSRVLLVLMQANAHSHVATKEAPTVGLAQVIAGESRLDDAIQPADDPNMFYLAGPRPEVVAPLLQSEKFRGVIGELRDSFDLVIFDSNGFLQQAESTLLPEVIDSVIFVMPEGNVGRRDLSSAMRLISNCNVRLLGSILKSDSSGKSRGRTQNTFVTVNGRA
jgi:receptor protein-tyrosine kinase